MELKQKYIWENKLEFPVKDRERYEEKGKIL